MEWSIADSAGINYANIVAFFSCSSWMGSVILHMSPLGTVLLITKSHLESHAHANDDGRLNLRMLRMVGFKEILALTK